MTKYTNTTNI